MASFLILIHPPRTVVAALGRIQDLAIRPIGHPTPNTPAGAVVEPGVYPDVANERLIAYFVPRGIQINQHG